ncbi:MAG: glycosyltransferase [Candidatus Pacebacteria bacterium]|nr:glycosyltransferase [Candidatus Paceibacterota bacterium]
MKFLSICIPTYEMKGLGSSFLEHSFKILVNQTFKDFDVVISDHSETNEIRDLCDKYKNRLNIKYFKNKEKRGNSSSNINNAIRKADGKLIKILFQDDFLYNKNSLQRIIDSFELEKDNWLVTACIHTNDGINFYRPFYPKYHDKIHLKKNTISSPSVLTIKNQQPLKFDENLLWYMDTDYYKRCYEKFGEPKILNEVNVVNRAGLHQMTHSLINEKRKKIEYIYCLKKNREKNILFLILVNKIKKYIRKIKVIIKKLI